MSSKPSKWLLDIRGGRHERNYRGFSVAEFNLFLLTFENIFLTLFRGAIAPSPPPYRPATAFDHLSFGFCAHLWPVVDYRLTYSLHLYSHKLQLQKQEFKKQRKKIHTRCQRTQRVKCILTMHSGSAR